MKSVRGIYEGYIGWSVGLTGSAVVVGGIDLDPGSSDNITDFQFHEYDTDWDSEAYLTVSGQNSNNSVRVPNGFFEVLDLHQLVDGERATAALQHPPHHRPHRRPDRR